MVVKGRSTTRTRTQSRFIEMVLVLVLVIALTPDFRSSTSTTASDSTRSGRMAVRNAIARLEKNVEKQKEGGWGTLISANQHLSAITMSLPRGESCRGSNREQEVKAVEIKRSLSLED